MNKKAIERTILMTHELEKRGVRPADDKGEGDRLNMSNWGEQERCGTVGCLAGWMTLDPDLRSMGLRNTSDRNEYGDLRPSYDGSSGDSAMQNFLEVSIGTILYLFGAGQPNSWRAARERLTRVLEGDRLT